MGKWVGRMYREARASGSGAAGGVALPQRPLNYGGVSLLQCEGAPAAVATCFNTPPAGLEASPARDFFALGALLHGAEAVVQGEEFGFALSGRDEREKYAADDAAGTPL